MNNNRRILFFIALSAAMLSIIFSLSTGSTSIPLYQFFFNHSDPFHTIIMRLRLPRTLTAFASGSLLGLAGSLMQLLLQNPLADPYVLGVSGGAAFFTLLMMLMGVSEGWLLGGAWAGSLLSIVLILLLARKHRWQTHSLLLAGIALACGFSACISFILIISPAASLRSMLFWLSGDLNDAQFPWMGLTILAIGLFISMLLAPGLNILGRGEREARALGLPSTTYRIALYLLSSLFTAAAVTLAGCIGFIGLLIPHFVRMLGGYDHKITLPLSALLGGSLLTIADTLARTIFAPQQIPVGILLAMIGVPVFVWMLQR
jgi:iron complex transport system permease protein